MKIISLVAENIKKLRAVEITPTGEIVTISGRNGQGKTSILDSIWWALAGTKNVQSAPIRIGQEKARIKLDLGDLIVERKFTPTGSTLSVESTDGARFPSPQKMLDALLGELSFDPLAFARMEPRRQFDELRRVSKLEVDIDKLDALTRADYQKRTEINRDAKAKRAQIEGVIVPKAPASDPVDESGLVDDLQLAGEANAATELRKQRMETARADVATMKARAAKSVARAADLRAQADALDLEASAETIAAQAIEKKLAEASPLRELIDVGKLRLAIEAARASNAAFKLRNDAIGRKKTLTEEAEALEAQSAELTARIDAREKTKQEGISKAAMPVADLGFGDGIVTYKGVPFDQASSAEQLKVSMSIAMAANPKLRVIRIVDGSLLDEDSLASIAQMAKAGDFQVWIERVDSTGKLGIVIDDGAVVATDGVRTEESAAE